MVSDLQRRGYAIRLVDTNRHPEVAAQYSVPKIPAFIAFDGSRELARIVGDQSEQAIVSLFTMYDVKQAPPQQGNGQMYVAPQEPVEPWSDTRVVRIRNCLDEQKQMYCFLSGSQVEYGAERYIVSCSHGLKGVGDPVLIIFNDGRTTGVADVVAAEPSVLENGPDCSVLKLRDAKRWGEAFSLSPSPLVAGQEYVLSGFVDGHLRVRQTKFEGLNEQSHAVFDGQAIPGESGGPIIDLSGRLCGVIHSCVAEKDQNGMPNPAYVRGERLAFGCPLHYIQGLLDGVLPGRPGAIIPRRDQMPWASGPRSSGKPPMQPYTPPMGQAPPAGSAVPPSGGQAPPFIPPTNSLPGPQQPPGGQSPLPSPGQSGLPPGATDPYQPQIQIPQSPPASGSQSGQAPPSGSGGSFADRVGDAVANSSSLKWWVATGVGALGPIGGAAGVAGWFIAWRLKKRLRAHLQGGTSAGGSGSVNTPFRSAA